MLSKLRRYARATLSNPRILIYRLIYGVRYFLPGKSRYLAMQRDFYERHATLSSFDRGVVDDDGLVGHYEKHNTWKDYDDYLMKDVGGGIALDFACGPGRNIIKYNGRFERIDGADISPQNIENAKINISRAGIPQPNLYVTGGGDIGEVPENSYDLIFSTIAMQHIAVYDLRFSILKAMFAALKPGGKISIQMGFGPGKPGSVDYLSNAYDVPQTNSANDTRVEDPGLVEKDLLNIGFRDFRYWVRPVGPGDTHPNWIFFQAVKPAATPPG